MKHHVFAWIPEFMDDWTIVWLGYYTITTQDGRLAYTRGRK